MDKVNSTYKNDNDDYLILLGVIVIMGFMGLTYLFTKHTTLFFELWKNLFLPIAKIAAWFSQTSIGHVINLGLGHYPHQAKELVQFLMTVPPSQYSWSFCQAASHFLGRYLLLLFLPIGGYLTYKTYLRTQGESEAYLRLKNAKEFMQYAKYNLTPNEKSNEQLNTHNENNIHNALSPISYCEKYHLVLRDEEKQVIIHINQEKAYRCFIQQLGNSFKNIETLLNQPYGWAASELIRFIPQKQRTEAIAYATQGHCYDTTVILSLLYAARRFNVVPIITFFALKKTYRHLWYALVSAGRKTVFVEGAGIIAQYEHEMSVRHAKPNRKPRKKAVSAAVEGLMEAVMSQPQELTPQEAQQIWLHYDPSL